MPTVIARVVQAKPSIVVPAAIDEVAAAVGARGPDQSRERIQNAARLDRYPCAFAMMHDRRASDAGPVDIKSKMDTRLTSRFFRETVEDVSVRERRRALEAGLKCFLFKW